MAVCGGQDDSVGRLVLAGCVRVSILVQVLGESSI
jgi:hypothetical protein